jgi:predicted Kef-type K+ transport protein
MIAIGVGIIVLAIIISIEAKKHSQSSTIPLVVCLLVFAGLSYPIQLLMNVLVRTVSSIIHGFDLVSWRLTSGEAIAAGIASVVAYVIVILIFRRFVRKWFLKRSAANGDRPAEQPNNPDG